MQNCIINEYDDAISFMSVTYATHTDVKMTVYRSFSGLFLDMLILDLNVTTKGSLKSLQYTLLGSQMSVEMLRPIHLEDIKII